jgi:hypothetical protein
MGPLSTHAGGAGPPCNTAQDSQASCRVFKHGPMKHHAVNVTAFNRLTAGASVLAMATETKGPHVPPTMPSAPQHPKPSNHHIFYLLGSATSASVTAHGSGGTHSCTAGEKGDVLMSFSISSTSCRQQTCVHTSRIDSGSPLSCTFVPHLLHSAHSYRATKCPCARSHNSIRSDQLTVLQLRAIFN